MIYLLKSDTTPLKDLLPLLSVVVTIFLFATDRYISFRIRRREARRIWYLKVLIDPNIEKISSFFDDVGGAYERATVALKGAQGNVDYLRLKSINAEKFIDLKRQLIAYLVQPLTVQYFDIAEKLTDFLNNLEDLYTTYLDEGLFSADDVNRFKLAAYSCKAELLDCLYSPLRS